MATPLSPEEIQELAAGYVLGDLDSAEAEEFRALLVEVPELQAEVAALQEALAMMPYGLEEELPDGGLRSQILSAAQTTVSTHPTIALKAKRFRPQLPWVMSSAASIIALVCGLTALHLNHQVQHLQTQKPQPKLAAAPTQPGITQAWSGLSQLLQDHQKSLANPQGPVDFIIRQPDDIPSLLKGFPTTVAALPLLPTQQGMLLGGSNCHLGNNPGLRLTYQLPQDTTVSAYQLVLAEEDAFPQFQSAHLTLQQPDGTSIVLWRDDAYLYALVAELPTAELQSLAYAIEGI